MRQHHTKNKGDLGILKVQLELHLQGFSVFTSQSEHEAFDLVAYKNQRFQRVQVKYRTAENGKVDVPVTTTWADKNGNHRTAYDLDEIDVIAVYCPDTDLIYFVPAGELKDRSTGISLRLEKPKNNQTKGVRLAEQYLIMPEQ